MSTIKCTTIQNLSGVEVYTAKAWVNFNGTGTVAIRASGNVSSITDNGVGIYTVNFTAAMPDVNYSTVATCGGGGWIVRLQNTVTTSSVQINTIVLSGTDNVAIFR
jgi:uncharacterized protein (AIM24 family)